MSSNSDLLAAESLLLTLITFLYSQAYPEISASAAIRLGSRVRGDPDVARDRRRIWATRKRVLALAGAALVVGLVFLPPAAALAWHFIGRLPHRSAFCHYDAVPTTLVLVTASCFLLALHGGLSWWRLTVAVRDLT